MFGVLPMIDVSSDAGAVELPQLKEFDYDFAADKIKEVNGVTSVVEGADALKIWVFKALRTPLARFAAYSNNYGSELETLIGENYTPALIAAEAQRMVEDALLVSPYITAVTMLNTDFSEGVFKLSVFYESIYGKQSLEVVV